MSPLPLSLSLSLSLFSLLPIFLPKRHVPSIVAPPSDLDLDRRTRFVPPSVFANAISRCFISRFSLVSRGKKRNSYRKRFGIGWPIPKEIPKPKPKPITSPDRSLTDFLLLSFRFYVCWTTRDRDLISGFDRPFERDPRQDELYIATATKRDEKLQEIVRYLRRFNRF